MLANFSGVLLFLNMLTEKEQIFQEIKKANNILITFNKDWNGDAVSSALTLYLYLRSIDKKCEIIAEDKKDSKLFDFLPSHTEIKNDFEGLKRFVISIDTLNTDIERVKYKKNGNSLDFVIFPKKGFLSEKDVSTKPGNFKFDLIISIDSPDLESIGKVYEYDTEFFYHTPIINIDHKSSNENFGQINIIDLTAVSVSEILTNIFNNEKKITEEMATCLLTGIISKTKNFRTPNITPKVLTTSSKLISLGADREKIVNKLYRSRSINVLKLWGRILARLTSKLNNGVLWSIITKEDFAKTNTNENDIKEAIDELIANIPEAKTAVIFYESEEESKKVSKAIIYSVKNINIFDFLKEWRPSGEKNLARITIDKPVKEAEKDIIGHLEKKLESLI